MADQPPANPYQFDSQTPYMQQPEAKPVQQVKSIKVLGIVNIVWGILQFLATCGGLAFTLATGPLELFEMPTPQDPLNQAMLHSEPYGIYTTVSGIAGLLFSIVLIASGMALIKYKRMGRTLGVAWCYYTFISFLLGHLMGWMFIYPTALEEAQAMDDTMHITIVVGIVVGTVFSFVAIIYPLVFLIYSAKAPFRNALD